MTNTYFRLQEYEDLAAKINERLRTSAAKTRHERWHNEIQMLGLYQHLQQLRGLSRQRDPVEELTGSADFYWTCKPPAPSAAIISHPLSPTHHNNTNTF